MYLFVEVLTFSRFVDFDITFYFPLNVKCLSLKLITQFQYFNDETVF